MALRLTTLNPKPKQTQAWVFGISWKSGPGVFREGVQFLPLPKPEALLGFGGVVTETDDTQSILYNLKFLAGEEIL